MVTLGLSGTADKISKKLTLTNLSAETGFFGLLPSICVDVASVDGIAAVRLGSRLNTWTVPLSLDTATNSGMSPRENAMLKILAGSAPRLSSCQQHMHYYVCMTYVKTTVKQQLLIKCLNMLSAAHALFCVYGMCHNTVKQQLLTFRC